ncbi:hypothetical protein GQ44DRAFT_716928 [Phaeosphaeriaceae sp. PMI808]|nr:hypothetical protein GQ44DRAFT_716928 [Phaeosphaeriaceae sp. PMI808]
MVPCHALPWSSSQFSCLSLCSTVANAVTMLRPGRVDIRVEFHLADEDMISQLFFFVYDPRPINEEKPENDVDRTGEDNVVKDSELSQLAQEFVAEIPEEQFSPAEIMSLLLENKQSPRHAIAGVDTWVEKIREERKKFGRANSWALDDSDGSLDH